MNKRIVRLVVVALAIGASVAYSLSGKGKLAHPRVSVMAPGASVQVAMVGDGRVDSVRSSCSGEIGPTTTKFSGGTPAGLACAPFDRFTMKRCGFTGYNGNDVAVAYTGLCVAHGTSALAPSTLAADLASGTSAQVMFVPPVAMQAMSVQIDDDEGLFTVDQLGAGAIDVPLARAAHEPFELVFTCHAQDRLAHSAHAYVLTDTGAEATVRLDCNGRAALPPNPGPDGSACEGTCGDSPMPDAPIDAFGSADAPAGMSIMSVTPPSTNVSTTVGMTGSASDIMVSASAGAGITIDTVVVSGTNTGVWMIVPMAPCSTLSGCPVGGGDTQLFGVRFTSSVAGSFDATVTFTTTAPVQTGSVMLHGTATNATTDATMSASPPSLRFDSVPVGGTLAKTYTLTNTGTDPLTGVTSGASSPFKIDTAVTGVPGMMSRDGAISCNPTAPGVYNGSASFFASGVGSAGINLMCSTPGKIVAEPSSVTASGPINMLLTPSTQIVNRGYSDLMISSYTVDAPWSGTLTTGTLMSMEADTLALMVMPTTIGTTMGSAHVLSNDSATPTLNIPLVVTGEGGTLAAAPMKLDFGNVVLNTSATATLTLTNGGNAAIQVSTDVMAPAISGPFPGTLSPGSLPITVTCHPTALGAQGGFIAFSSPDAAMPNSATVTVTCNGIDAPTGPKLAVSPQTFATMVPVGSMMPTMLALTNPGGADLMITSATRVGSSTWTLTGACATGCTIPANTTVATQFLTVTYKPTMIGATDSAMIMFASNDSMPPTVSLTGTGVGAGLTANPTSLDFGTLGIGMSAQRSTLITDTGNLAVSSVTCSVGAPYHVDLCPTSIAANTGMSVMLSCTPTSAGAHPGTLTVSTPDAPSVSVALTCVGASGALIASPTTVDFGEIRLGDTSTHTQTVNLSSTGAALTLTQQPTIATPVAGLAVGNAASTSVTTAPDPFVVSYTAGDSETAFSTQITAVATTTATITATGKVVTAALDPATSTEVSLGSWCVGQATTAQQVSLHSTGTATLHVNQPTIGAPFVLADVTPAMAGYPYTLVPGGTATVSVLPPTSATAGHVTGTIAWNADLAATTPVSVDYVTDASVAPKLLMFQTVAKTASMVQLVTFENCGSAPIAISGASVDHDSYLIDNPPPQTLPPGVKGAVGISFHPDHPGFDNATLTIAFGDGSTQTVDLHGTGVGGDGTSGTPDTFYGCGCRSSDPRGLALVLLVVLRRRRCGSR